METRSKNNEIMVKTHFSFKQNIRCFRNYFLFVLFILGMFMLCFNKMPKFLSNFISNYPKTSYYLCAIGWIPYFMFIVFVMLIGSGYIIDYSDTTVEYSMNVMSYPYTTIYLAIASLIIAFVRKTNK